VAAVLVDELVSDCVRAAGTEASALIDPLVQRIKADNSFLEWGSQALADAWGVAEPIARAAQAIMQSGSEDHALTDTIRRSRFALLTVSASVQGSANAARTIYAVSTPAQRAAAAAVEARKRLIASPVHALPALASAASSKVSIAIAAARPPPPAALVPVAVVTPSGAVKSTAHVEAPASSTASGLVVGASIGVVGLAVLFFFKG
jgi:hypothetical protein